MSGSDVDVSQYKLRQLRSAAAKEGRLDKAVIEELASLPEEHRKYVFRPETRCRVCLSEANSSVNKMLANALTYAEILRVLKPINDVLPKDQRITYASIRTHATRHFPIEETAAAVYRKIIEKRAEEYDVDFVTGVGSALTPIGFLDVAMHKSFETMIDPDTAVGVETGIRAAKELHVLTREKDEDHTDIADIMLKVNRIMEAVKSKVPAELWPEILAAIDETDENIVDAEFEDEAPEVSGYDPGDPDFEDGV